MNKLFTLGAAVLIAAALLPVAEAAPMTRADYDAAIKKCNPLVGDPRALCTEAVQQQWQIESRRNRPADSSRRQRPADYYVAMKKCKALSGSDQAVCSEEAKQKWPLPPKVDTAPKDAATVRRDADYAIAIQQCNTLVGDPQALCTETAKQKFGKH
ncbi:hypothetical protein [uncultured Sphaerotilus sp.]|uniref:hypothetical protein n=1 Tax=uncultured Sphaerotilus sp. TaxID=474984 RepID=UPI0030CA37C0